VNRLEAKRKGKEASQKLNKIGNFTKGEYLQKHKPSDQFSGYMRLRVYYIRVKLKITKGGQVYATSASRSVAEVGVAEAAPALGGGTDPLVTGVEEIGVVEVAEAAEGEIIDAMPGAYLFAFSKKAFSSDRGQPREELTFSQSTSSPCA
jgi:hypothetical protein